MNSRGFTLVEVMAATTIAGLVMVVAMTAARIGLRAWEKQQKAVVDLRHTSSVADIIHQQISAQVSRQVMVSLPNRRMQAPFFFAEERRLVFLTSYAARERGRGGIVAADYACEPRGDGSWNLWLDERSALDAEALAEIVEDVVSAPGGQQHRVVLRAFERSRALRLWEGLRDCRFAYWRQAPPPAEWVAEWSMLGTQRLPAAITAQLLGDALPVFVRLSPEGLAR